MSPNGEPATSRAYQEVIKKAAVHRHCLGLVLALLSASCNGERGGTPAPQHPDGVVGTKSNFGYTDWAARRSRITSMMPEVEVMVRDTFRKQRLPSLVAGFLVDGQLVWWQGFGSRHLEDGGPVTAHTVYRIASITKVITAMAVLRLRDEGKLPLDTPAITVLPDIGGVRYPTADSPQITIRHLLTHTSGLPRLGSFDYTSDRAPVTEREILVGLRDAPLENVPGMTSLYSNLGYALLGIAVARVAKAAYHEYVDRTILAPLDMVSTLWRREQVAHDRLATGYAWDSNAYHERHHWPLGAAEGMGGLYSSLDDMVRFLSYHMTAWPPGGRANKDPLHNATLRESHLMGGHQPPKKGVALGGWVVEHQQGAMLVSHGGETHQYASMIMFAPDERIGFVAMTNTGKPTTVGPLAYNVMNLVLRRVRGGPRRSQVIRRR